MWVIHDRSGSLLANAGNLACMGEPLIIVTASSILYAGSGPVFKYPFQGGKNCPWQNVLKETKSHICLFRPQFVDTLFIVRLRPNLSMLRAVIINY